MTETERKTAVEKAARVIWEQRRTLDRSLGDSWELELSINRDPIFEEAEALAAAGLLVGEPSEEQRERAKKVASGVFIDGNPFSNVEDAWIDGFTEGSALSAAGVVPVTGSTSDGHHTFDELYDYRMLYNAHAATGWLTAGIPVVKSWKHSDGEPCFGVGWFIVTATLPTGQVSNHYRAEHWDLFAVPEAELPPEYDGHTPQDAAERLRIAAGVTPPAPTCQTCNEIGLVGSNHMNSGECPDCVTAPRVEREKLIEQVHAKAFVMLSQASPLQQTPWITRLVGDVVDMAAGALASPVEPVTADEAKLAEARAEAVRETADYLERIAPKGLIDRADVLADMEIAADRFSRGIHANGRERGGGQ
ncbi:hypothetical protein G7068_16040 [Leucobacter viscericola]|uniref:WDGH domain-containing protein n=1 Tax=Leucobacter viscericola TaxID=2714935 RepID=A0A6G7XJK4_9MICO|nr:hypothetical protein [Leucobacter viscericola]QIK64557.1 hypothetical protein G7068_16040 [Leucobacter viscericola]